MSFKKKSGIVAVTGASGHVGGNLIRALIDSGRECRALVHRDTRAIDGLNIERVKGELSDPDSLVRAFTGAQTVFHLAARISIVGPEGGLVHNTNVLGTRNVVSACLECGVKRLVHFSSIHAFSQGPLDRPLDETRPLRDDREAYAYDRSKAQGIGEILEGVSKGLDAVIVHPTAVLGPFDYKPSAMGQALLDMADRRLPALVDGGFDWVDARDVAAGAIAAEEKGRTGEKYLLSGHWLSMRELAAIVEEVSGAKAPRLIFPMWAARFAAPIALHLSQAMGKRALFTPEAMGALRANRDVRHDKAGRELGYSPRPVKDTVRDALAWFEEAGMCRSAKRFPSS